MPLRPPILPPIKPVPEGTFPARVIQVIYEGTVPDTYKGAPKNLPRVRIAWEVFSKEKRSDGKNFTINQKYTFSYSEKANLRKVLQGILGRNLTLGEVSPVPGKEDDLFDLETIIGKDCMVTITHKINEVTGKIRADVATVSATLEDFKVPELTYPTLYFNIEEFVPENMEVFNQLPEFIQEEVKLTPEYHVAMGHEVPGTTKPSDEDEINIDDIPF